MSSFLEMIMTDRRVRGLPRRCPCDDRHEELEGADVGTAFTNDTAEVELMAVTAPRGGSRHVA